MSEGKQVFEEEGTRYLCDVIEDMRKAWETRNFSYLLGMIEEVQYRANRMENRISMIDSVKELERTRINLSKEVKKLREERNKLKAEKGESIHAWDD